LRLGEGPPIVGRPVGFVFQANDEQVAGDVDLVVVLEDNFVDAGTVDARAVAAE
jgi:hypothetical protein